MVGLPHLSVAEAHTSQFIGHLQTKGPQLLEALHSGLFNLFQRVILGRIIHLLGKAQDPTSGSFKSLYHLYHPIRDQALYSPDSVIPYLEETGHRPYQLFEKLCLLLVEHCVGAETGR